MIGKRIHWLRWRKSYYLCSVRTPHLWKTECKYFSCRVLCHNFLPADRYFTSYNFFTEVFQHCQLGNFCYSCKTYDNQIDLEL